MAIGDDELIRGLQGVRLPHLENVTFNVSTYRDTALPYPLAFPPPYADRSDKPLGYAHWWQYMQLVFDLPDPSKFPRLDSFSSEENLVLDRFMETCEELSEATILSHDTNMTITLNDGEPDIVANFPKKEAIRGAAVLFRQLNSPDELASYGKARNIISRHTREMADHDRDQRKEWQARWGRAAGKLNAQLLTAMADRKVLTQMGAHPDTPVVGEDVSPTTLISIFQYGDLIHWGRRGEDHRALMTQDSVLAQRDTMNYLESVIQLSHYYLGYSLLVRAAR
jgi:hypothetical protein